MKNFLSFFVFLFFFFPHKLWFLSFLNIFIIFLSFLVLKAYATTTLYSTFSLTFFYLLRRERSFSYEKSLSFLTCVFVPLQRKKKKNIWNSQTHLWFYCFIQFISSVLLLQCCLVGKISRIFQLFFLFFGKIFF